MDFAIERAVKDVEGLMNATRNAITSGAVADWGEYQHMRGRWAAYHKIVTALKESSVIEEDDLDG